jgi:hypothetical protein
MTWSELIAQGAKFAPNACVYISIHPDSHLVRQNWPVVCVRKEGELVFLDGLVEERESNP